MQYNIFQNDFYEDGPGVPWAYRLTLRLGEPPIPIEIFEKSVKDVKLPEQILNTHNAFFGGMTFKIPTRYKNTGEFNITFNDNKLLSVYKSILSIFRRSYDNRFDALVDSNGNEYQAKYSDMSQPLSLVVEILDPEVMARVVDSQLNKEFELETNDPEIVAIYTFGDCFFKDIEDVEFDYSSEEIVEWSIPVVFNSISIEYPGKSEAEVSDISDDATSDVSLPSNSSNSQQQWDGIPKRVVSENMYGTGKGTGGSGYGDGSGTGNGTGGNGSSGNGNGQNGTGGAGKGSKNGSTDIPYDSPEYTGKPSAGPVSDAGKEDIDGISEPKVVGKSKSNGTNADSEEAKLNKKDSKFASKAKDMFGEDEYNKASAAEKAEMRGFAREEVAKEKEDARLEKIVKSKYENLDEEGLEMLKFREANPGIDTMEGARAYKYKNTKNGVYDSTAKRKYDEYWKWRQTTGSDID